MTEPLPSRLYRFRDLKDRGIVSNRMTLWRWQRDEGFPAPLQLGPRVRAWDAAEVDEWVETRKLLR